KNRASLAWRKFAAGIGIVGEASTFPSTVSRARFPRWLKTLCWAHATSNLRARKLCWSRKRFDTQIRASRSRRKLVRQEAIKRELSSRAQDERDCLRQKSSA